MTPELATEIPRLSQLNVAELLVIYRDVCGEASQVRHKQHLVRQIIWGLQCRQEGGLSQAALRRAAELIEPGDLCVASIMGRPRPTPPLPRKLLPGTILCRRYRGRMIEVKVLEQGFEYQGQVYPTLSRLANEITGSHWNGKLFFRIRGHAKKRQKASRSRA